MRLRLNGELVVGVVAVILGLLAGALLMVATGNDALEGYEFLFKGGLMNLERIGNTLATATPLILTGLSVAFAFRTGLFNIGTPGQVLIGGVMATVVGLLVDVPKPLLLMLTTMAAIAGGIYLKNHDPKWDLVSSASVEIGLVFAVVAMSSISTPGTAKPMIAPAVAMRWSS